MEAQKAAGRWKSASVSGLTTWGSDIGFVQWAAETDLAAECYQVCSFQLPAINEDAWNNIPFHGITYGALGESTYKTHYWLRKIYIE